MPGAGAKRQASDESAELTSVTQETSVTPDAVLSDFGQICVGLSVSGALIAVRELTGLRCTVSFGNAPNVGSRLAGDAAFTMRCVETAEVVLCEDATTDLRIGPLVAARL